MFSVPADLCQVLNSKYKFKYLRFKYKYKYTNFSRKYK